MPPHAEALLAEINAQLKQLLKPKSQQLESNSQLLESTTQQLQYAQLRIQVLEERLRNFSFTVLDRMDNTLLTLPSLEKGPQLHHDCLVQHLQTIRSKRRHARCLSTGVLWCTRLNVGRAIN
jgi:hypothetical protein